MLTLFRRSTPEVFLKNFAVWDTDTSHVSRVISRDGIQETCTKVSDIPRVVSSLDSLEMWSCDTQLNYLSRPCTKVHDPVREIISYSILSRVVPSIRTELFTTLISWNLVESSAKLEITMRLAKFGNMEEHYHMDKAPDKGLFDNVLVGSRQERLSVGIRLLFGVYALNYIADIANNDLNPRNVLLDITCFEYAQIQYLSEEGELRMMVLPTYGIKPIICDFGMATRNSSTFREIDDFEDVLMTLENTIPAWKGIPVKTHRSTVLSVCERLHRQLLELDSQCTAAATQANMCVLDLTGAVDVSVQANDNGCILC